MSDEVPAPPLRDDMRIFKKICVYFGDFERICVDCDIDAYIVIKCA
jgi:hypothetical protein